MKGVGPRRVQTPRRTPLYERHAALGARLVPFAGWEMPVQYTSITAEHRAVRTSAGVFDVSHMGQLELAGEGAHEYLQARLSNDLDRIEGGRGGGGGGGRGGPARLWDAVVERGVVPCGLGARDTLRLEACYPLHGNDITPERTPIEAGLGWACALDKDFTGVEVLRRQKEEGPKEKLIAFVMEEPGIPRKGMPVEEGGEVTSGSLSPMLSKGIGLAYVPSKLAQPDTTLTIDVRGRPKKARVVKKPIYKREES